MIKYICIYSEMLERDNGRPVYIEKNKVYFITGSPHIEYYELFCENKNFVGEIWGEVSDYFITIAEWRDKQINEILND